MKAITTRRVRRLCGALLLFASSSTPMVSACIWDSDTIKMENSRFPEVIDIIAGNFPRHSKEFHAWRAELTRKKIAAGSTEMALYDDQAVSLHKLGNHQTACDTMKTKDGIYPGIYETHSNMGTFLIYTGDLSGSLRFINKALSIKPDAHFGREKYQKWLVEWIIAGMPELAERAGPDEQNQFEPSGYAAFVLSKQPITVKRVYTEALRAEAIKGVLGMMRFADHDNPHLLEALGDLLVTGAPNRNAAQLAGMAYRQALQKNTTSANIGRLQKKLLRSKLTHPDTRAAPESDYMPNELKAKIADANKLAKAVRDDEVRWISEGQDPASEFHRKYLNPR